MYKLEKRYDELLHIVNVLETLIDEVSYKDVLIDLEILRYHCLDELCLLEEEILFNYTKQDKIIKKLYESLIYRG